MSRALEKDFLALLKSEDPKPVYQDIVGALTNPPDDNLLEIELLGKSHPLEPGSNYLQDGTALAIPKLRLVQAFFVARQILHEHLSGPKTSPEDEVVKATTVLLLMDPEHLTAANIRKRAVQVSSSNKTSAEPILRREKQFVDSLLTARLYRHTKSTTLWSHRRWLMQEFGSFGLQENIREDLINVIMVAAERHPRNYYAWDHARWLVSHPSSREYQASVYASVVDDVQQWCFRHHDDISGWMYFSFVILSIESEKERANKCSLVLKETMDISRSFHWVNESVWVFLRTLICRKAVSKEDLEYFEAVNELLASAIEDPRARVTLNQARCWASHYSSKSS